MNDQRPNHTRPTRTVRSPAAVSGVGLFSGLPATVTIHPAPPEHGFVFERVDLDNAPAIPARIDHVSKHPPHPIFQGQTARNTSVAFDPTDASSPHVHTVEHLLAALAGLGLTDALLTVDAAELPIDDGSAKRFADAIVAAGIQETGEQVPAITLTDTVSVGDPSATGSAIHAAPADSDQPHADYSYHLDYGPLLGNDTPIPPHTADIHNVGEPYTDPESGPQSGIAEHACEDFLSCVAPARTFSLEEEAVAMKRLGLFPHLTARDMLVIGPGGPIDNAYRVPHEPARHKLLDLIGDLALVGRPILARVHASRSGHALNHALARALVGLP